MTAAAMATDFFACDRATDAQQIAAEQLAAKSAQLARITASAMTPAAKERARFLRREIEAACTSLRRAGL